MKKPIHEKKVYSNIREVVDSIADLYGKKTAFSYRFKATDKEVQHKSYE